MKISFEIRYFIYLLTKALNLDIPEPFTYSFDAFFDAAPSFVWCAFCFVDEDFLGWVMVWNLRLEFEWPKK